MVELVFLGGAREVGRLSILVESDSKLLLEHGIDVQTFGFPIKPKLPLDAVFLSHAHLDHSGFTPELYKRGYKGNVYATPATFDLISMLLRDSIKIQNKRGEELHYLLEDIKRMEQLSKEASFRKKIKIGNSKIEFLDAGHVPGSSSILIESGGRKILFTGDIKFIETDLMKGADTDLEADIIISEATYSYRNHPDRKSLKDTIREIAQHIIYNNGILLLPCFAVGRTQELLLILHDLGFPMYMDGMGIEATLRIMNHPDSVKNPEILKKAFSRANKIKNQRERKKVAENPCIVITTAGMLNGGPIGYYMKKLHEREDCAMILTGFQVPGTVGRTLLDTGRYVAEGLDVKPKLGIEFMDFSAHTDRYHLIDFYKKINPEKIFLVHGDRTEEFANELKGMGFDASAPENGQKLKV